MTRLKVHCFVSQFLPCGALPTVIALLTALSLPGPAAARQPSPAATQAAACELMGRLASARDASRRLVQEVQAWQAMPEAAQGLSKEGLRTLLESARRVNDSAEKMAQAPATVDPEVAFNLGKHMNVVNDRLQEPGVREARARSPALEGLWQNSLGLGGDTAFVLANLGQLKDSAARCPRPGGR